jgi:hypothetical protein
LQIRTVADAREGIDVSGVKRARSADFDEALVRLWNELEPLRLAGDVSGLDSVERMATRIAREGDEAQRRDAERLLETIERTRADAVPAPATVRLDADVAAVGEAAEPSFPDEPAGELETTDELDRPEDEGEPGRRRVGWFQLLWIAVFVIVVIVNFLAGRE